MNLIFPLSIGERPCDRTLMLTLAEGETGCSREEVLGWMLLVWKDFALDRDERRKVPTDALARSSSPVVRVIEQFIGWAGLGGDFVQAGIDSGFFSLVPCGDDGESSWLVLVDFFPANKVESTGISQQKRASQERHHKNVESNALKQAGDQLKLFKSKNSSVIQGFSEHDVASALTVVASICNCMKWQMPAEGEWRQSIMAQVISAKMKYSSDEMKNLYLWLQSNRDSELIPPRVDLLVGEIGKLVDLARRDYSKGSSLDSLDFGS